VLARAGEPGQEFFMIVDGTARVDVNPKKQIRLGPGAFFGEMSLLDGGPRSATVVAETPVRLLVINRRNFSTLLTDFPDLTLSLLAVLSKRVRQAEGALAP
jgi:CRP-like cAMP-binding protein